MLNYYFLDICFLLSYYNRWRVLHTSIQLRPENAASVTFACCVLHNMLSMMRPKQYMSTVAPQADTEAATAEWRDQDTLDKLVARRGQRNRQEAVCIRDYLRNYYNTIGEVPWQENACLSHVSNLTCINLCFYKSVLLINWSKVPNRIVT